MKPSQRSAVCLRLDVLNHTYDSSEGVLLWVTWSFLAAPRPALSPLYTVDRQGYIAGMDSLGRSSILLSVEPDQAPELKTISGHDIESDGMTVVVDEFDVYTESSRICTDGEFLYYYDRDVRPDCIMRVSLSSGDSMGWIPSPSGGPDNYLCDSTCVSNGQLFTVGYKDRKLYRTKLAPPGASLDQSVLDIHCPIDSVKWEVVADIPGDVCDIDIIARDDDKFQLVCVLYEDDRNYIHFVDFNGNGSIEPYEPADMCKFVPSYDELVCVAARPYCKSFSSVSLLDIWSMSVLFTLRPSEDCGQDQQLSCFRYLAITQSGLVVLTHQKTGGGYNPLFTVMASRVHFSTG
ncbi:hypothetical protein FOL46_005879 [Perkinsus olseni]|uniref:Uncharacterized protein n=1 Tax=Perkinsus olseni TaxID=32597 RepID=A0A7J6LPR8_PEROL|nr:hypothetical protein FOL46_005879 [Perkinsus olseni]